MTVVSLALNGLLIVIEQIADDLEPANKRMVRFLKTQSKLRSKQFDMLSIFGEEKQVTAIFRYFYYLLLLLSIIIWYILIFYSF